MINKIPAFMGFTFQREETDSQQANKQTNQTWDIWKQDFSDGKKSHSVELLLEEPSSRLNRRFKGPDKKKGGRYIQYITLVYQSKHSKRSIGVRSCKIWVGRSTSFNTMKGHERFLIEGEGSRENLIFRFEKKVRARMEVCRPDMLEEIHSHIH